MHGEIQSGEALVKLYQRLIFLVKKMNEEPEVIAVEPEEYEAIRSYLIHAKKNVMAFGTATDLLTGNFQILGVPVRPLHTVLTQMQFALEMMKEFYADLTKDNQLAQFIAARIAEQRQPGETIEFGGILQLETGMYAPGIVRVISSYTSRIKTLNSDGCGGSYKKLVLNDGDLYEGAFSSLKYKPYPTWKWGGP